MTLQAHYVPKVIVFEFRWTFDKLYSVLNTYFEWFSPKTRDRHNNGVEIEMDVFSLSSDYPVVVTGIYDGSRDCLNKYLQPFVDLKPIIVKIENDTYVEAARYFIYPRFPPPYFKNKSYYAYDVLPIIENM